MEYRKALLHLAEIVVEYGSATATLLAMGLPELKEDMKDNPEFSLAARIVERMLEQ